MNPGASSQLVVKAALLKVQKWLVIGLCFP
jgi:hypothetical protein